MTNLFLNLHLRLYSLVIDRWLNSHGVQPYSYIMYDSIYSKVAINRNLVLKYCVMATGIWYHIEIIEGV